MEIRVDGSFKIQWNAALETLKLYQQGSTSKCKHEYSHFVPVPIHDLCIFFKVPATDNAEIRSCSTVFQCLGRVNHGRRRVDAHNIVDRGSKNAIAASNIENSIRTIEFYALDEGVGKMGSERSQLRRPIFISTYKLRQELTTTNLRGPIVFYGVPCLGHVPSILEDIWILQTDGWNKRKRA